MPFDPAVSDAKLAAVEAASQAFRLAGNILAARDSALEALSLDPMRVPSMVALARAMEDGKDYTIAAAYYAIAAQYDQTHCASLERVRALRDAGNCYRLSSLLPQTAGLDPTASESMGSASPQRAPDQQFAVVNALFSQQRFAEAAAAYAALATQSDATASVKARAWNNISACYASMGDYKASRESALEAIVQNPTLAKAYSRVAVSYEGEKDYTASGFYHTMAGRLTHTQDSSDTPHGSSATRTRNAVPSSAAASTHVPTKGLPVPPPPAPPASATSKATRDAFYYAKSLERGTTAMQRGEFLEAVRQFGKALDLFPAAGTPRERAVLRANRSAAYFRVGRYPESVDDAQLAVEADSCYARGYFRLACARQRTQHVEAAFEALEACLLLEPEHEEGKKLMAEVRPLVEELRKSAVEKNLETARAVQEAWDQQQSAAATSATARVIGGMGPARASNYIYCSFCNEHGHNRSECPLRLKRSRGW